MAAALERVEGDRDLLEELVRIFADECPGNLKEIRLALSGRDAHALRLLAHTVKGAAMNLGALKVSEAALALENQARAGDLENAAPLAENLAKEIELLMPEMESLCRKVTH
jgi:HPt (histidine-containing phosphotransfer) domain-containing protein